MYFKKTNWIKREVYTLNIHKVLYNRRNIKEGHIR